MHLDDYCPNGQFPIKTSYRLYESSIMIHKQSHASLINLTDKTIRTNVVYLNKFTERHQVKSRYLHMTSLIQPDLSDVRSRMGCAL